MAQGSTRLMTAAIDFGTTYSGYAYGFKSDLEKDTPSVKMNTWIGGRTISHKAPTCVLFNPQKEFHSFGYKAEDTFADLCGNDQHRQWFYFRRFKMILYENKNLKNRTTITEENGKSMRAIDVFSAAIRYLKQHLMDATLKKFANFTDDDIHWVLTVPAIWNDASKQFMRNSAERAGISHDQLTIALEPEAAAIYCMKLPTEKVVLANGGNLTIDQRGSTFMVVDLGGGTADITVHQRQHDHTLKELSKPSGGKWGGIQVDKEFLNLLFEIFGGEQIGKQIMDTFKQHSMDDFIDLFREFEVKKRETTLDGESRIFIRMPLSLVETFEEITGEKLKTFVTKTRHGDALTLIGDKLRFKSIVLRGLFEPTVDKLITHLTGLFSESVVKDVGTILLVGGFSACPLVQEAVMQQFNNKTVFVPDEPDLSVLIGAVMYGFNPDVIQYRVARFTYGSNMAPKFNCLVHSVEKRFERDGVVRCRDVFSTFVKAGETLKVGEWREAKSSCPISSNQTVMTINVYASTQMKPIYVTDAGCQFLGKLRVCMPDLTGGLNRKVVLRTNISGTAIKIEAKDETTGKFYETQVDFLG